MERRTPKWIYPLQLASISLMWIFVVGISAWILHLIRLSRRLHDVPSATVAISIVAIPVFITGAVVLSYVFFGLTRDARSSPAGPGARDGASDG